MILYCHVRLSLRDHLTALCLIIAAGFELTGRPGLVLLVWPFNRTARACSRREISALSSRSWKLLLGVIS
jgi:hypothetical protein